VEASREDTEAEEYVAQAAAPEVETPSDLLVLPTEGYAAFAEQNEVSEDSTALTQLENQAHSQRVLLSSDAMRYFIAKVPQVSLRSISLDKVIEKARASFPTEDGWVVINLVRMEQLVEQVNVQNDALIADEVVTVETDTQPDPITAGSLAEAIVTGNVTFAYEMISHRPMVALADATADLDALYRYRKGEEVQISEMLKAESIRLSEDQLTAAIAALTSSLDGTYTDEASAVKMAIMKAVKALS
jgi:hypothetical protein